MSESGHHIVPMKTYTSVFIALLVLTAITVLVAQFDFGALNGVIAMFVATIKASLVALFFMHLKYEEKANAACLIGAFLFLGLFLTLSALDYATRIPVLNTL